MKNITCIATAAAAVLAANIAAAGDDIGSEARTTTALGNAVAWVNAHHTASAKAAPRPKPLTVASTTPAPARSHPWLAEPHAP